MKPNIGGLKIKFFFTEQKEELQKGKNYGKRSVVVFIVALCTLEMVDTKGLGVVPFLLYGFGGVMG